LLCFVAVSSFCVQIVFTPLQSTDWLCELVSEASQSVYVCSYSLDEKNFLHALSEAARRGVDVKVIFETGTAPKDVRVRMDVESSLLHLKFIVVDEERIVLGSANFTENSLKRSINDLLYIEDRAVGSKLASFFDGLWNGEMRRFEARHGEILLANFDLEDLLLRELSRAKETVDVAMFALTHPKVWAMLKVLSSRKVRIRLLVDRWFLNHSALRNLPDSGIELRVFEPFTLHSKLFIIDGRVVVSGSANATKSAYERNAELMMVIREKSLVQRYREFFEKIWQEGKEP
jgi:phosphatidylserine/phosphatidylglycerophosphate/cardiolipin synthase-like enzyme